MKPALGQLLSALLLIQCGPVQQGPREASAMGPKPDPPSTPGGSAAKSEGASSTSAPDPPPPKVVPAPPIASGLAEADPRLVVRNAYLKQQHVFLGSRWLGAVAPGAEGTFEIPPGAHNVTFSDSRDGVSNRKTLAEVFDSGYAYQYDVLAR